MAGTETAAPGSVRPRQACEWLPGWSGLSGSVSPGPDGEGVEVVGQDRPSGPDPQSVISLQSGAPQSVSAFEMTDPALDPGAVAGSAFAGASAAGFVAAGDVDLVAAQVGERFAGQARLKAAIGDDLPRPDPSTLELGRGL